LPTKKAKEAFETSNLILSLETECENLRSHLKNSVPESEFLHEKKQYVAVIDNLIEENMHLRQIIGEYEQHCRGFP
jgi:hypothetical protein